MAQAAADAGAVPADFGMTALELVLRRTAAQAADLKQLLSEQQTAGSPNFHRWLTPLQFGQRFGASDADLQAVSVWLQGQGFTVGSVPAGRGRVPFSGTAAQVQAAFASPIHYFNVAGTRHFANTANPQIPARFGPLIGGIRGLHDFHPKSSVRLRAPEASPAFTQGGGHFVGPADFATIYNLAPLYQDQVLGTGVSIAIVSQSDIDTATPTAYWAAFGISRAQPVSYLINGTDPGKTSSETETDLDVEIAGSLAPNAQLIVVTSTDAISAAAYAINMDLAPIISSSYGACEKALGAGSNLAINSDYEQASAQGITVVVATGDQGSAACDSAAESVDGLAVNGLASTPYDVAVGGTDFNQSLEAAGNYWNSANAPGTLASALSYIPETTWNDSCAALANPLTACNAAHGGGLNIEAASGGLSSAALANGSSYVGYAQPVWQAGVGITSFGARALPDISLQASDWAACVGASGNCAPASGQFSIAGGTSVAAPAFAAIMALLDQTQISSISLDGRQGLINPQLYLLAAREYGSSTQPNGANLAACNSGMGAAVGSACVFYDITMGNIAVPCNVQDYVGEPAGTLPRATCATAETTDQYGVLELNSVLAYTSGAGYDLATGLGSVNAANLVYAATQGAPPTSLSAVLRGTAATLQWSANPKAPAGTTYNVNQGTTLGGESTTPVQSGISATMATVAGLSGAGQTYYFRVAGVSGGQVSTLSNEASVTVAPAAPAGLSAAGSGTAVILSWTASFSAQFYDVYLATSSGAEGAAPFAANIAGTRYTATGLTPGLTYFFEVTAVNGGGPSAASAEASATLSPIAPTGVSAVSGEGEVVLTWTPSGGASSYNIFQGTAAGGESATPALTVNGAQATLSGLTHGDTYFFTVQAVNSAGTSATSSEVSATVLPAQPAGAAASAGNSSLTFSWSPAAGAESYQVFEGTASGAEAATPVQADVIATSITLSDLTNGQAYYLYVKAVNAGGSSPPSAQVSATPQAPHGGGALRIMDLLAGAALAGWGARARARRGGGPP